jgi:hypothetical protein
MPKIRIDGSEYELPETFTFREMGMVKRVTGLRAGEIYDAFASGDTDAIMAFALVAMKRADPATPESVLLDKDIGVVEFVADEPKAADVDPPATTPVEETPTGVAPAAAKTRAHSATKS